MTALLVFLLTLPLAVYTFAGLLGLIDQLDKSRALFSLVVRVSAVVILTVVVDPANRIWIAAAFLLVAALHIGVWGLTRWLIRRGDWITDRIE